MHSWIPLHKAWRLNGFTLAKVFFKLSSCPYSDKNIQIPHHKITGYKSPFQWVRFILPPMQGGTGTKGPHNKVVLPLNLKSVINMGFKDNEKITLCLLTFLGGWGVGILKYQTRSELTFTRPFFIMFHNTLFDSYLDSNETVSNCLPRDSSGYGKWSLQSNSRPLNFTGGNISIKNKTKSNGLIINHVSLLPTQRKKSE